MPVSIAPLSNVTKRLTHLEILNMKPTLFSPLLTTKQAADYLSLTNPKTLEVWRCTKRYPLTYIKVGGLVRYRLTDLDAFIVGRTVTITDIAQV